MNVNLLIVVLFISTHILFPQILINRTTDIKINIESRIEKPNSYLYKTKNILDTSEIKISNNNKNRHFDIFGGVGLVPFKLNGSLGYFITDNIEANIQYSNFSMPLGLDVDVLTVGSKFYAEKSSTVYTLALGRTFSRKFKTFSPTGFCLEASLGYLFEFSTVFYFLPSLKIGGIFRNHKKPYKIMGVDFLFGIIIK